MKIGKKMSENSFEKIVGQEVSKLKLPKDEARQMVSELDILSNLIIDSYLENLKKEKK
ncbi:MAG: hypothetical protein BWY19_01164 [bacterium ADurb.Bin212]|nr:MAG: hypothetical protein BWY19_01164 [bacterium ADurb.Bin212]